MKTETPCVTWDFFVLCVESYHFRETTLLHTSALAKLTATSSMYWETKRVMGIGPKYTEKLGEFWYTLKDVQDWLEDNVFAKRGGGDD